MNFKRIRIGIDPGGSGAIAISYQTDKREYIDVHKMPETEHDMATLMGQITGNIEKGADVMCYLERVHAYPAAVLDKSPAHAQLLKWLLEENDKYTGAQYISLKSTLMAAHESLKEKWIVSRGVTSTWTFALNYGAIKQALADHKIPFEEVTPQAWQKAMGIVKTKEKRDHKNNLKAKAQNLYPEQRVTLETADALLILKYGCQLMFQPKLL